MATFLECKGFLNVRDVREAHRLLFYVYNHNLILRLWQSQVFPAPHSEGLTPTVHGTEHRAKRLSPGCNFSLKADLFSCKHMCRAVYLERLVPAETPDKMWQASVRQNDESWTGAESDAWWICGEEVRWWCNTHVFSRRKMTVSGRFGCR